MRAPFFKNIYKHPSIKKEDYQTIMAAHTKVEFGKAVFVSRSALFRKNIPARVYKAAMLQYFKKYSCPCRDHK